MSHRGFLSCCIVAFLVASSPAADDESSNWKAGVAKVVITPERPMWMSGYASRTKPAEGKQHDLWAKAIALESGTGERIVLITLDLVGIDRELSVAIREDLRTKHGLKREAVALACSHTHSGPVVGNNLRTMYSLDDVQNKLVDDYSAALHAKVVGVVGDAIGNLAPARVQWGNGHVTFAVNRRTNAEANVPKLRDAGMLKGPVDHDVPVLSVRDLQGKLRAIVFGYACHSTVFDGLLWSGDYPGFAQLYLERAHPGAVALFWAGCGADQNPLPRRRLEFGEEYGRQLGEGVQAVLRSPMKPLQGKLSAAYREIDVPFADLPTREQFVREASLTDKKNHYVSLRAKYVLDQIAKKGSMAGSYPYPVQVWQLGPDLTWVTLGGEVVVDYSLRLKKELGQGRTWVASYSNDVMAYIPSLRVLKEGGYEGGGAMLYYGLPTVWGPRVEDVIVGSVHKLDKQSAQK
jgi:neutral ceramidase